METNYTLNRELAHELEGDLRSLSRAFNTKGFRIIVDGQQITFKTNCAKLRNELVNSIVGQPSVYRNMLGELCFDFDND